MHSACELATSFTEVDADGLRVLLRKREEEGLVARTRARRLSALRQFMSWMVADGYRRDNPVQFLDSPKLPAGLPKSLGEEEITRLLAVAQRLPAPDDLHGCRAGTVICRGLAYLRAIKKIQDISPQKSALLITGKGGKER